MVFCIVKPLVLVLSVISLNGFVFPFIVMEMGGSRVEKKFLLFQSQFRSVIQVHNKLELGAFGSERSKFLFCSIRVLLVLAPSQKPTKHEKVMTTLELSRQFEGFQDMMKQSLDKLCALESWHRGITKIWSKLQFSPSKHPLIIAIPS